MYNQSKYVEVVRKGSKIYLVNTMNGSLVLLDELHYGKYLSILRGDLVDEAMIDILLDEGILYDLKGDLTVPQTHDVLSLTLLSTTRCNMQCTYCFERLKNVDPYDDYDEDLLYFIKKINRKNKLRKIDVNWVGGEPLLNLPFIESLSRKLIDYCADNSIKYSSGIITNGTLLSREVALALRDICKVSYAQITLDGPREIHNERRPYGNKDGFELIVKNIKEVCEILKIVIRVNVDEFNVESAKKLIEYVTGDSILNKKIYMDFAKVEGNHIGCFSCENFGLINMELQREAIRRGLAENIKHISVQGQSGFCGAISEDSFVIYPDGKLYRCYEIVGREEYAVGDISQREIGIKENVIAKNFILNEKCTDCSKLPLCRTEICPLKYKRSDRTMYCNNENVFQKCELVKEAEARLE